MRIRKFWAYWVPKGDGVYDIHTTLYEEDDFGTYKIGGPGTKHVNKEYCEAISNMFDRIYYRPNTGFAADWYFE